VCVCVCVWKSDPISSVWVVTLTKPPLILKPTRSTVMILQETNLSGAHHTQHKAVTPKNIVWLVLQVLFTTVSFTLTIQSSFIIQ